MRTPHGEADLVQLDRDHPGFRDPAYRARRNDIARLALSHVPGAPVPDIAYSAIEHEVWRVALEHLTPLHARYACQAFRDAWPLLSFASDRVPEFSEVNTVLQRQTGFGLSPVAGLVTPRVFFEELGNRLFLATQYMRHHSAPLYTPEPDVIHELVGHAALLADVRFSEVNRLFGQAVRVADERTVEAMIRVYWYTLEFGVARSSGGLEVVGAGLLSSYGELGRFETEATLRPFSLEEVAATPFDPTNYQSTLFVAESSAALLDELTRWLERIIGSDHRRQQ